MEVTEATVVNLTNSNSLDTMDRLMTNMACRTFTARTNHPDTRRSLVKRTIINSKQHMLNNYLNKHTGALSLPPLRELTLPQDQNILPDLASRADLWVPWAVSHPTQVSARLQVI